LKGTCRSCYFWWKGDGFCSKLGIIRPPAFSCSEYRGMIEGDCADCIHYVSRDRFCRYYSIVEEPEHGCRRHSIKTMVQLNRILDKLAEG